MTKMIQPHTSATFSSTRATKITIIWRHYSILNSGNAGKSPSVRLVDRGLQD